MAERSQDLRHAPPHRCEVLASAVESRSPGFSSEVHHLLTGGSPGDVTPVSVSLFVKTGLTAEFIESSWEFSVLMCEKLSKDLGIQINDNFSGGGGAGQHTGDV